MNYPSGGFQQQQPGSQQQQYGGPQGPQYAPPAPPKPAMATDKLLVLVSGGLTALAFIVAIIGTIASNHTVYGQDFWIFVALGVVATVYIGKPIPHAMTLAGIFSGTTVFSDLNAFIGTLATSYTSIWDTVVYGIQLLAAVALLIAALISLGIIKITPKPAAPVYQPASQQYNQPQQPAAWNPGFPQQPQQTPPNPTGTAQFQPVQQPQPGQAQQYGVPQTGQGQNPDATTQFPQ
jgi:hypothetical protein